MNNWFRFEIQIRLQAYSHMEALAQQKACQGRDVCLSNITGSPNTTPAERDSTTPRQPVLAGCIHSQQQKRAESFGQVSDISLCSCSFS